MIRLLMVPTLLVILLVTFTVPAFADGPQDNLGQNWSVPPGERDETVHLANDLAKDSGMSPGQWSVDWKRDHNLIPGWEGNGGGNNPYNNP